MARPSKLTPAVQRAIVASIKNGAYTVQACAGAGIAESTYYAWMDKGREAEIKTLAWDNLGRELKQANPDLKPTPADKRYQEFMETIKKAEAKAENDHIQIITTAAIEQWTAAAWYLERKHWHRWGGRTRIDANVSGQMQVERPLEEMTDEELEEFLQGRDD